MDSWDALVHLEATVGTMNRWLLTVNVETQQYEVSKRSIPELRTSSEFKASINICEQRDAVRQYVDIFFK